MRLLAARIEWLNQRRPSSREFLQVITRSLEVRQQEEFAGEDLHKKIVPAAGQSFSIFLFRSVFFFRLFMLFPEKEAIHVQNRAYLRPNTC